MIYWAYDKECKYCNQKKFVLINYGMSINKYKDVVYKQKVINDIFWDLENDCLDWMSNKEYEAIK